MAKFQRFQSFIGTILGIFKQLFTSLPLIGFIYVFIYVFGKAIDISVEKVNSKT